jgi:hypothetical protein
MKPRNTQRVLEHDDWRYTEGADIISVPTGNTRRVLEI